MTKKKEETYEAHTSDAHTSDGEERPNVEPRVAPAVPPQYFTIGEGARVGVLNDFGTMINAQLTYWGSAVTPVTVLSRNASHNLSHSVGRINALITTMNAACTEQNILNTAGQRMSVFGSLDYNAFTPAMNAIRSQLQAMQVAKP